MGIIFSLMLEYFFNCGLGGVCVDLFCDVCSLSMDVCGVNAKCCIL